jgi:Concanavalin A-like lectin/glucanases superfamily
MSTCRAGEVADHRCATASPRRLGLKLIAMAGAVLASAGGVRAAYVQEILADNPAVYLRFDETSGSAAQNRGTLGATHDGTYNGNFTLGQPGAILSEPAANNALRLTADTGTPANSGHVLVPANVPAATFANSYSIEMWIKPDGQAAAQDIFAGTSSANMGNHFILMELLTTGRLRYLHRAPAAGSGGQNINPSAQSFTSGPEGRWHHVVAVLDNVNGTRTMKLYLDGQQDSVTTPATGSVDADVAVILGRLSHTNNARPYTGLLDELAIYGYALDNPNGDSSTDDSRVAAHYAAAIPEPAAPAAAAVCSLLLSLRRRRRLGRRL